MCSPGLLARWSSLNCFAVFFMTFLSGFGKFRTIDGPTRPTRSFSVEKGILALFTAPSVSAATHGLCIQATVFFNRENRALEKRDQKKCSNCSRKLVFNFG